MENLTESRMQKYLVEAVNNPRLVPVLVPGKAWRVDVRVGSRKNGTMRVAPVSEPVYTLAQAEFFIMNNRARDFEGALK